MSCRQWKCPACGAWLPDGYSRHVHFRTSEPTLEDMIAARRLDEMHISTDDPVATRAEVISTYWRSGHEETREQ